MTERISEARLLHLTEWLTPAQIAELGSIIEPSLLLQRQDAIFQYLGKLFDHLVTMSHQLSTFDTHTMTAFSDIQASVQRLTDSVTNELQRIADALQNADPSDTETSRAAAVASINALSDKLDAELPATVATPPSGTGPQA